MKIKLTDQAVEWFKDELDLPENNKVLQFYVEPREDVEIGYEENYNDLILVVSEEDLWYFEDNEVLVEKVDHDDEIVYSKLK